MDRVKAKAFQLNQSSGILCVSVKYPHCSFMLFDSKIYLSGRVSAYHNYYIKANSVQLKLTSLMGLGFAKVVRLSIVIRLNITSISWQNKNTTCQSIKPLKEPLLSYYIPPTGITGILILIIFGNNILQRDILYNIPTSFLTI